MLHKRVLVTGGTRGIGFAIAALLVDADYEVFVTGKSVSGEGPKGTKYFSCDFSNQQALANFSKQIAEQKLDILINNAGINKIGPMSAYSLDDFQALQQVNVVAPFLLCQAVTPGMCERRFGRIVNITSVFSVVSRIHRSAYSASKFGLFGLSRALALEVAKNNVLVNCLAPGFIETDLTKNVLGHKGIEEITKKIPMGRLGKPEEIAYFVKFLVSEENTYLTGQNIVVDGGYTCE